MRILILNWRCPKNPKAGGAEFLTFEIAKRLVGFGHSLEWFTASFPGASEREVVDGVLFVRAGRQWTVHVRALTRYRRSLRDKFDLVIDEINTMPFFTPLWAGIPVLTVMHQLAREVWWYESVFPFNAIGYLLEPLYLRPYRRNNIVTISGSTKRDLLKLGFRGSISVIPVGIAPVRVAGAAKAAVPTFIYVGRFSPSKRIQDIIRALAIFRRTTGVGQLILVGGGNSRYARKLKRLAEKLGVYQSTKFVGYLTEREKQLAMAQSHALLMASVREGWGLAVTEANACGTPAIVYDVPGLRDSVRNNDTGLLVGPTPEKLAEGMRRLLTDERLQSRLSRHLASMQPYSSLEDSATAMALNIAESFEATVRVS